MIFFIYIAFCLIVHFCFSANGIDLPDNWLLILSILTVGEIIFWKGFKK